MNSLSKLLNSNGLTALVTFLVGLVAFVIYVVQKRDHKKDAANIVLLEIQSAERDLKKVKEHLSRAELPTDVLLMQSESWSKYKYLFVRDFDRDEWDAISDFYAKCQLMDEAIKLNNAGFWDDVKEIRVNKQRALADYLRESLDRGIEPASEQDKFTSFDEAYMAQQQLVMYNPVKPINDVKAYLDDMNPLLSQSSIGSKLKKMARIKS